MCVLLDSSAHTERYPAVLNSDVVRIDAAREITHAQCWSGSDARALCHTEHVSVGPGFSCLVAAGVSWLPPRTVQGQGGREGWLLALVVRVAPLVEWHRSWHGKLRSQPPGGPPRRKSSANWPSSHRRPWTATKWGGRGRSREDAGGCGGEAPRAAAQSLPATRAGSRWKVPRTDRLGLTLAFQKLPLTLLGRQEAFGGGGICGWGQAQWCGMGVVGEVVTSMRLIWGAF